MLITGAAFVSLLPLSVTQDGAGKMKDIAAVAQSWGTAVAVGYG